MIPHLRNPYDFVPLEGRPTRSIPVGADYAYNLGLTGTITCELEIVTPVFVGAVQP